MQVLYNKEALCYIERANFTDIQGIGSNPMYERFDSVFSVIKKNIAPEYQAFLAQPILSDNKEIIVWYASQWNEKPIRLVELEEESQEQQNYNAIKEQTCNHYLTVLGTLDSIEKKILSSVLKHYSDEYVYCYDNKVVLAVWGMKLRDTIVIPIGQLVHGFKEKTRYKIKFDLAENATLAFKNDVQISRQDGHVLSKEDLPQINVKEGYQFISWEPDAIGYEIHEDITFRALFAVAEEPLYNVSFDAGEDGYKDSSKQLKLPKGSSIEELDIPLITANDGYKFINWAPSHPSTHILTDDIVFVAQYEKEEYEEEGEQINIKFDAGENGEIDGEYRLSKPAKTTIPRTKIPTVIPHSGYTFVGWDKSPYEYQLGSEDVTFTAKYEKDGNENDADDVYVQVNFEAGNNGKLEGNSFLSKPIYSILSSGEIPTVIPKSGYRFTGWDKDPNSCSLDESTTFSAQYEEVKDGWYTQFTRWVRGDGYSTGFGWRRWLLYILLGILLLLLLCFFLRQCHSDNASFFDRDSDSSIEKPIVYGGSNTNIIPNVPRVTPLTDSNGNLAPIVTNPGVPDVVADRLNIYFEDNDVDFNRFATDFNQIYSDDKYKIIGHDNLASWVQIQIPPEERNKIRNELPTKLSDYKFFVVDESLFERKGTDSSTKKEDGWHLKAVLANEGWEITKGSADIVVAVIDGGFDLTHSLLKNKIVKPYNVFTQTSNITVDDDHGTVVASLAVGESDLKKGISGIAPNCKLMPIQVFDKGRCPFSALANGIVYAIHQNADVINISLATPFRGLDALPESAQKEIINTRFKNEELVWRKIVNIAKDKNTVIVFAAGNDNVLTRLAPEHRTFGTINVTAVDDQLTGTKFSNYGEGSVVSAPGIGIYSISPMDKYTYSDGTSVSAPMVSGTIALMKSLNKDLTVSQISQILVQTGKPTKGRTGPMIQVSKALEMVQSNKIPQDLQPNDIASGTETGHNSPMPKNELEAENSEPEEDYEAIRQMILKHRQEIKKLEKLLPQEDLE